MIATAAIMLPVLSVIAQPLTADALFGALISALFIGFLANFPILLLGGEITLVQIVGLGVGMIYGTPAALLAMTAGHILGVAFHRLILRSTLPSQQPGVRSLWDAALQAGWQVFALALAFAIFRWNAGVAQLPGSPDPLTLFLLPLLFGGIHTALFGLGLWLGKRQDFTHLRQDVTSLLLIETLPAPFVFVTAVVYPAIGAAALAALGGIPCILAVLLYGLNHTRLELERRLKELSTLQNISNTLRSTLAMEPLLETIHLQVTQLMGVESFYVALYDAEKEQIWYPLAVKDNQRQYWRERPIADRLTDRVILQSKPILLPRQARESLPGIGLSSGEEALNAWLGVPLITPERTIGCLALLSASPTAEFTQEDQDLLMILSGQVSVAFENALLYKQAQSRAAQLENLNQISTLITASLNLPEVLEKVCKAVIRVGGGQQNAIYLLNPEGNELHLAHSQGLSVEFVQRSRQFSAASGARTQCLRTGKPYYVSDIAEADLDETYQTSLLEAGIRAFGDFPLTTPDGQIGFLSVYFNHPHHFQAEQIELLQIFTSQAALAVANARLHAQTDQALSRRVHQLSILEAVGRELSAVTSSERLFHMILDYTLEFTHSTWGCVMVHDPQGKTLEVRVSKGYLLEQFRYPDHVGIVGRAIRLKQAVKSGDVQQEADYFDLSQGRAKSHLSVPLIHEGRVLGAISIESPHPNAYQDSDLSFVNQLANQAAIALVNASLHEETQRRLREQTSLFMISSKLVASPGLDDVAETIRQSLAAALSAALTGIYLWDTDRDAYALHAQSLSSFLQAHNPLPDVLAGGQLRTHLPKLQQTGTLRVYQTQHQLLKHLDICAECQALILPLTMSGEHFGIVVMHAPKDRQYSDEDMRLARTIAAQGSIAIQNALLFKDVIQGRDHLQAVLNSVNEGILMIDSTGLVTLANDRIAALLQNTAQNLRGVPFLNLPAPALRLLGFDQRQAAALIQSLQQGLIPPGSKSVIYSQEQGPKKVLECLTAPVWGQGDRALGLLIIVRDITEEHEINQARELLTQTVIHDLKSPMTSITSALSLIEEAVAEPTVEYDILEQSISIAARASHRILSLVDALLDIARMESGLMFLELSQVDLRALFDQAIKDFLPQAAAMGVVLRSNLSPDLPPIQADPGKLIRVLANLLDNALKFTPTGGNVVLSVERGAPGQILIQIADTGPGIPAEFREKIFDRFSQVPGQPGRTRGSGLGLTFCRLAVEAHGGRIWVEPNPAGGSLFILTLPVQGPPQAKPAAATPTDRNGT